MVDNVRYYNRYWNDFRSKNNHKINRKVKIWHVQAEYCLNFDVFTVLNARSKNGKILTPEPTSVYLRYTLCELYRTSALTDTSNREQ